MTYEIRAIFENGVLRPLDPITLVEHDVVTVVVRTEADNGQQKSIDIMEQKKALLAAIEKSNRLPVAILEQQKALREMFAEAESLPNENPGDNFSGTDHDLVLYGWKK